MNVKEQIRILRLPKSMLSNVLLMEFRCKVNRNDHRGSDAVRAWTASNGDAVQYGSGSDRISISENSAARPNVPQRLKPERDTT